MIDDMWLRLLIAALATWRVSYMLVEELGPFDVFKRLRERAGTKYLRDDGWPMTNAGRLLDCIKCTSVWIGALFGALAFTPLWVIAVPFALSAPAVFIRDKWGIPFNGE